jgi:hypothetical protein
MKVHAQHSPAGARRGGTILGLTTVLLAATLAIAAPVTPGVTADKDALDTAQFLLRQCLSVSREGDFHNLLRALRHLRDPDLGPLYERLATAPQAALQVHGILGLAEISKERRLDLKLFASVDDPVAQAEMITAALDADLLSDDQIVQLLDWPGLDIAVRTLLCGPLVQHGRAKDVPPTVLAEAIKSDNLGRQALAAALLTQMGDARGPTGLTAINASDDPRRDRVRLMTLEAATRYRLDQLAPWATQIAAAPDTSAPLANLALRVAMRFGQPEAVAQWRKRYGSVADPAERIRLALLALRVAPWQAPDLFAPLQAADDPLLKAMGQAGNAIAAKRDIPDAVVNLIQLHHPMANQWALQYARDDAAELDAKMIFLALILGFDSAPPKIQPQLLDDAIAAAQAMIQRFPDDAIKLLNPIVADAQSNSVLVQGILLGLLRSRDVDAYRVIEGLPPFTTVQPQALATLLLARTDRPMTVTQVDDLALIVRGGGRIQDSLRVQAAWCYLQRIGQAKGALAAVLK